MANCEICGLDHDGYSDPTERAKMILNSFAKAVEFAEHNNFAKFIYKLSNDIVDPGDDNFTKAFAVLRILDGFIYDDDKELELELKTSYQVVNDKWVKLLADRAMNIMPVQYPAEDKEVDEFWFDYALDLHSLYAGEEPEYDGM